MIANSGSPASLKRFYWPLRLVVEKERKGWLFRLMRRYGSEVAYIALGLRGLEAEIEFPSDWHEEKREHRPVSRKPFHGGSGIVRGAPCQTAQNHTCGLADRVS